jgi:PKD repeat protein
MAVAVAPIGSPVIRNAGYVNDTVNRSNVTVFINFTDQSTIETHWILQRQNLTTSNWTDIQRVPSYTGPTTGGVGIVFDPTLPPNTSVNQPYRILAANVIGDTTDYGDPAVGYPTLAANSTPSGTTGAIQNNPANVTAIFTGSPRNGPAPLTVFFTGPASASGWVWNFGDGDQTNATGIQNPIHTYLNSGSYRVNLTTMSIGGNNTNSTAGYITVGTGSILPPVANFTAFPLNGTAPLTVTFTDLSVNATTWDWSFGDNWMRGGVNMSNSTLINPTHTYLTAGNYTVSLNVTNSAGSNMKTKIGYINLTNATDRVGVTNSVAWYLDYNGNGTWDGPSIDNQVFFGITGFTPVVGDWNGNGKTKAGVYSNGTWYLDYNGDGFYSAGMDKAYSFGGPGNLSVVGDWNGDGRTKIGLFNPTTGVWNLDMNATGVLYPVNDTKTFVAPIIGTPVVGDWNGNGITKIGVTNGIDWYLDTNGNGVWDGTPTDQHGFFGIAGFTPVVGDWNGNGTTKIGVTNDIDWYLDTNGNGVWDGTPTDQHGFFGIAGFIPVVGDWSGDGRTKIGVTNQVNWYLDTNGNGVWDGPIIDQAPFFGISGFTPVVGKW